MSWRPIKTLSTSALLQTGTSILTLHRPFLSVRYLTGLCFSGEHERQLSRMIRAERHAAQWWRLRESNLNTAGWCGAAFIFGCRKQEVLAAACSAMTYWIRSNTYWTLLRACAMVCFGDVVESWWAIARALVFREESAEKRKNVCCLILGPYSKMWLHLTAFLVIKPLDDMCKSV